MPINSKLKGKRGELMWAKFLREKLGIEGCRRGQQYSGSPDSPDVVGVDGIHFEVKNTQTLNLNKALAQAIKDAGYGDMPVVASKRNHGPWIVSFLAVDMLMFIRVMREAMAGNPLTSSQPHNSLVALSDSRETSTLQLATSGNKPQTFPVNTECEYTPPISPVWKR